MTGGPSADSRPVDPTFQTFHPWEFEPGPDLPWLESKAKLAKWGLDATQSLWMGRWRMLLPLMRRKGVTEIIFFGSEHIDVETGDGIFRTSLNFDPNQPAPPGWNPAWHRPIHDDLIKGLNIIQRELTGREVWTPGREMLDVLVEGQLEDGSRLEALLDPCCTGANGAYVVANIRRFAPVKFSREDFIRFRSFTERAADVMEMGIKAKATTLVAAGTGTGKTTLFEYLLSVIPHNLFVNTVEDTPELQINHPRHRGMRTREKMAGLDPNEIFQEMPAKRLLVANMRLRPDWLVVGEIRDEGVADTFISACMSGHAGGATIHAETTYSALSRLENMLRAANPNMKDESVRKQLGDTLRLLIILEREPVTAYRKDGSPFDKTLRRVLEVSEILGSDGHSYFVHPLFETRYEEVAFNTDAGVKTAMWPALAMVGLPFFGVELEAKGVPMPAWWGEAKFELISQIPRVGRVAQKERLLHI